jgi:hypothetical protein
MIGARVVLLLVVPLAVYHIYWIPYVDAWAELGVGSQQRHRVAFAM